MKITLTVSRKDDILTMGDYTMMTQSSAKKRLEALGYRVDIEHASCASVPEGYVISTFPAAGEDAKIGQTVTVTVCNGK